MLNALPGALAYPKVGYIIIRTCKASITTISASMESQLMEMAMDRATAGATVTVMSKVSATEKALPSLIEAGYT